MVLALAAEAGAQSQPSAVILNPNGVSRIFPPFDSGGWVLTRGNGADTHQGDDYFAQDWSHGCFSQGEPLYAGISGSLHLNKDRDGKLDAYGNTALIVDFRTGFAQRFAHLESFFPLLSDGDLILAGQLIGYVGSTGNAVASSECAAQGGRGAHAHIALYKNAPTVTGRPLSSVVATGSATSFAAQFTYATQVPLLRSVSDPTVYAILNGWRWPVTASVFANNGWDFDRGKTIFNPIAGNYRPDAELAGLPVTPWFWPTRNWSLVKTESDPTVYLLQDGQRKGLTNNVFSCRQFRLDRIKTLPGNEPLNFEPVYSRVPAASGCQDEVLQATRDMAGLLNLDRRIGPAWLGTYGFDPNWDPNWELRYMDFDFNSGSTLITIFHATDRNDSANRYATFWDPLSHEWKGWYRLY
jgi:murein DD-endopeptidase MepM/ murein hydrolase activator NlpD